MERFNYDALRDNKVIPLIYKYGTPYSFVEKVESNLWEFKYDPSFRKQVWVNTVTGEISVEEPEDNVTEYTGECIITRFRIEDVDNETVLRGDRRLLAIGTPKPKIGQVIEVGDTKYSVVLADEVAPGGVDILYRVHVRV